MITKKDIIVLFGTLTLALCMAIANNLRLPKDEQLEWLGSPKILEKPPELENEK